MPRYPFDDVLFPDERHMRVFVRAIFFRKDLETGDILVLMQQRKTGVHMFPGGGGVPSDTDCIEALYRELCEETLLNRRMWLIRDLLYSSRMFAVDWGKNNRDVYFVVEWKWLDQDPIALPNPKDEDDSMLQEVVWVSLRDVVEKNKYHWIWYQNIITACRKAFLLTKDWVDPEETAVWVTPNYNKETGKLTWS